MFILQVSTVQCVDFCHREMVYYYSDMLLHALASVLGKQNVDNVVLFYFFFTKMNVLSSWPLTTHRL